MSAIFHIQIHFLEEKVKSNNNKPAPVQIIEEIWETKSRLFCSQLSTVCADGLAPLYTGKLITPFVSRTGTGPEILIPYEHKTQKMISAMASRYICLRDYLVRLYPLMWMENRNNIYEVYICKSFTVWYCPL